MPTLIKLALFIPAFFMIVSLCACFQRVRAKRKDGWFYLTPGLYQWTGLFCGFGISVAFTLAAVAGRLHGVEAMLTVAVFIVISLVLALQTLFEEVRWNEHWVERRTLFGRRIRLGWAELAFFGPDWTGYRWISSIDGPKLRFSPHDNGAAQLMAVVIDHLRRNGPPPETVAADARTALAFATVVARRR